MIRIYKDIYNIDLCWNKSLPIDLTQQDKQFKARGRMEFAKNCQKTELNLGFSYKKTCRHYLGGKIDKGPFKIYLTPPWVFGRGVIIIIILVKCDQKFGKFWARLWDFFKFWPNSNLSQRLKNASNLLKWPWDVVIIVMFWKQRKIRQKKKKADSIESHNSGKDTQNHAMSAHSFNHWGRTSDPFALK